MSPQSASKATTPEASTSRRRPSSAYLYQKRSQFVGDSSPCTDVRGGSRKFARVTVRAVAGGSSEAMEGEAWFSSTYEMKLGENPARVASLRAVRFLRRAKLTQQLSEALFRLADAAPCAPSSPALFSTSLLPLDTSVPVACLRTCLYSETVHRHTGCTIGVFAAYAKLRHLADSVCRSSRHAMEAA